MNRTTIDFGIDLGTTNSAIAVLNGVTTDIIKNNDNQDVTPSAVSYGKNGQLFVGTRAKNTTIDKPEDAYVEFKRRMGTDYLYSFRGSGLEKRPEELSAEILKSLRTDVSRSALGEEVQAAVITVPAAFELHQCDATRKAAELAGLKGSPLLQEPVAAALAYGFQIDSEKAYWLVYDFGGGTFDAALIKSEEGLINVVHHGGDNFLGGSNIDWGIMERIICPKLSQNFNLPDFKRGVTRWNKALAKLKRSVESAKIELTTKDSTTLADCVFEDADGETVDCDEITLSRNEVISIAEPLIVSSAATCLKVFKEKNLPPSAVQRVILVGGPTKAPYFREILQAKLGIPLDCSMDPLTVVARGAAVFAGTQKLDRKFQIAAKAGEYRIELSKATKSVGHELDPLVGGKVVSTTGEAMEGFTIELVNPKTQWRSGKVSLRPDGVFMLNLLAEKGERNTFNFELYDAGGSQQVCVPSHLVYTVGAVVEEQPLINSMGVALASNKVDWFFKKGTGLPQKKKGESLYQTIYPLKAGEAGSAIKIPIVEGENEVADRNRHIGDLNITSDMIRRDLAVGSEIDLTLKIDESRIITVNAYIPVLDEEFEETLDLRKSQVIPAAIKEDCAKEMERMKALVAQADAAGDNKAAGALAQIEGSNLILEVKQNIEAAAGDPDAAEMADKRLLELKLRLDEAENAIKWPLMMKELNEWVDDLDRLVKQHGNENQQQQAAEFAKEAAEIIEKKQADRASAKQSQIVLLYFQILYSLPAYWVNQFRRMEGEKERMSDSEAAERLLDMGRNYLDQNNIDGLKNVVRGLWDLLPKSVSLDVQRGFGAGISR